MIWQRISGLLKFDRNILSFNKGKYIAYQDDKGSTLTMMQQKKIPEDATAENQKIKYFDNFDIPW